MRLQLEVSKSQTEAAILMLKEIQAVRNELAEEHRAALYVAQQLTKSQAHAADLEEQLAAAKATAKAVRARAASLQQLLVAAMAETAAVQAHAASLEQQLAAAHAGPVVTLQAHATDAGQQPASAQ
jgi:DNA repair exonuclease SbcCD ATPase subunit